MDRSRELNRFLARRAGASSSTLAAVYNAANEVAVDAFIQGKLTFPGIWKLVEAVMNEMCIRDSPEAASVCP